MKISRAVAVLWPAGVHGGRTRRGLIQKMQSGLRYGSAFLAVLLVALAVTAQQPPTTGAPAVENQPVVQPVHLGAADLRAAPHNPEFVKFTESVRAGNVPVMQTLRGHSLGYIPEPLDLTHLKKQPAISPLTTAAFPASFDLRTQNKVTPVRDQGACGACWTFGTFGSAESLLKPTEARDFSENNLKNRAGFDLTPCQGGNYQMSSAYLARWSGPVNETADPYQPTDNPNTSPTNLAAQKREMQIIFIAGRNSATDNDQIKAALTTRGAVAVSMWMDEASTYLNTTNWSYYFDDANVTQTNHAVTVVGWDDNYSKTKFTHVPAGDGAFLVKNSWGTTWGNAGYFWVSYYSLNFIEGWAASFGGELPTTNYAHRYEYDPLGWVDSLGFTDQDTFYYANIYTATEAGYLDAVTTYIAANGSPYTLKVYKGVSGGNPVSGTLMFTDIATVPYAGYQVFTVTPIHLIKGDVFSIVMKLQTPGYDWPAPLHIALPGYSSAATSAPGRSFYSGDGVSWGDIAADYDPTASFALKAFTSADTATPTTKPTFTPAAGTYSTAQTVTITGPAGSTIYYTLDGSSPTMFSSVYSSPVSVYANTTLRAIATTTGHSTSAITTAKYTINLPQAAAPTITPAGGTYGTAKSVVLSPVTSGTSVYYTLDGSTPTRESNKCTAPIAVTSSLTIKAMAASASYSPSAVVTAVYKLLPSPQTLTGLATSITTTTATLNGAANNFGGNGQVWFQWGVTKAFGNLTAKTTFSASPTTQNFSAPLTSLTSKTTYYFRPVISSLGGITYGATQSFTTN